jgi:nitric oxide dioxygenase
VRSQEEYLHRADIEQAIQAMPQLKFKLYTSQVSGDAQGRLTIDDIPTAVLKNAEIYMCGPTSFMQAQKQRLVGSGVDTSSIHKEVFGPDLLEELV